MSKMRAPSAKSKADRRSAATHGQGPEAAPNKSEFIAVESATHRRSASRSQRKRAPPLRSRSAANGNNGKPEAYVRREESAVQYKENDEVECVEVQEGGAPAWPLTITFRRAPSPYKSNPFRLAVALKVKYAYKFTDAIVSSRPRGCK